ncbi:MAG: M6 family metalloprotease-like protein [Candidatus Thalassarchaeaceae archaeon]|jgi:M6 family metalloprotease-like protein
MNRVSVVLATLLIFGGMFAQLNSEYIENRLNSNVTVDDENSLIPIQKDEEWLILKIEFSDNFFDTRLLPDIFEGEFSAVSYIKSISPKSNLNVTIIDEVWHTDQSESFWGKDSENGRDVTDSNGVQNLVKEAVNGLLSDVDLSKWDFNNDGIVDRLLIIHSGNAQESSGITSSIWSHFSGIDQPIEISKWSIEHYTIVSLSSGLGTIMHEMLHQMGAVDLYDVHSKSPSSSWNGLGIWDIMAGGNWNGDGKIPSLPSASTLDLIGAGNSITIIPNNQSSIHLSPISEGGHTIKIIISPSESIRMSVRSNGFDSSLPSSGLLVEHQDLENGNLDYNLVNTDPNVAWLKIIEADGNDALQRGRNMGEAGDLFKNGSSFGNKGIHVRDNHGRLVTWTATIINSNLDENSNVVNMTINFENYEDKSIDILTPRSPIELLPNEITYIDIMSNKSCDLNLNVTYNGIKNFNNYKINTGVTKIPLLNYSNIDRSNGQLKGYIGCNNSSFIDIEINWIKIGHKLILEEIEIVIPWNEDSRVAIYPEYIGNESRIYSISVSGAISRISEPITQGRLNPGEPIILEVSPDGLLESGMVAKGEIIFIDGNSLEQRLPIILQAESPFIGEGLLPWISQPGNGLFLISILLALSLLTNKKKTK